MSKITSIEDYDASETNLYRDGNAIVMPVSDQAVLALRPWGGSICELHLDDSWCCLTTKQMVDLRFALGEMLKDLGVKNVD